ncbi:MAG: molybdenum cofactor guanylyltransferase [Egibacteraceae bacterium]
MSRHTPLLTGLVLAGGRSRRMGTDKALLPYRGERLVDRAVRILRTCCAEVLVAPGELLVASADGAPAASGEGALVAPGEGAPAACGVPATSGHALVASGEGARLGGLDALQVADAVPGAGPLGGLVAGLEAAAYDLVAVLAVDMPYADPTVLQRLAAQWGGEAAVIPRTGGRLQPLHAVWARAAAPDLRALLTEGERSVTAAAERLGALVVDADAWGPFAFNMNRPEDLPPGAR